MDYETQQAFARLNAEWQQKFGQFAASVRVAGEKAVREAGERAEKQLTHLATIAQALSTQQSHYIDPGTLRIEDIPGERIPFTAMVDIVVGPDVTSVRQSTYTNSQDGPFVATKRFMTFQSAYEFQTTDPATAAVARVAGRSFGRYRPVHSACDVFDANHNAYADSGLWLGRASDLAGANGLRLPSAAVALPSQASSFRTMEFDGRVVVTTGSSYQLNNTPPAGVPSSQWTSDIVAQQELGALLFLERGDTLTFEVTPLHSNNPGAGNVDGAAVFGGLGSGALSWPFIAGQYDPHEGVATPNSSTSPIVSASPASFTAFRGFTTITTDTVVRIPNGIVTIGYEGYKIRQPMGPAR